MEFVSGPKPSVCPLVFMTGSWASWLRGPRCLRASVGPLLDGAAALGDPRSSVSSLVDGAGSLGCLAAEPWGY